MQLQCLDFGITVQDVADMKIDYKSLEAYSSELASLAASGLPLPEGLKLAARHARKPSFRHALSKAAEQCACGKNLSDCLAGNSHFPELFVSMVRAGECGGNMEGVLRSVVEYLQTRRRVRLAFRAATVYPAAVLSLAVFVSWLVTFGIMPDFMHRLQDMHVLISEPGLVPGSIRAAMWGQRAGAAGFAVLWLGVALICLSGLIIPANRSYHRLLLRLPLYGPIFQRYLLYHFSAVIGLLAREGTPVFEALENLSALGESPLLAEAACEGRRALERGQSLSAGLAASDWFPPSEVWMMQHAEKEEQFVEYLADLNRRSIDAIARSERLLENMEPTLILGLALLVTCYLVSVLIPLVGFFRFIHIGE